MQGCIDRSAMILKYSRCAACPCSPLPNGGPTKLFSETIGVDVIARDVLTAVAAGHQMVDSIGILEAQSSWHALHTNTLADGRQEQT
jgi:hypothetical protein